MKLMQTTKSVGTVRKSGGGADFPEGKISDGTGRKSGGGADFPEGKISEVLKFSLREKQLNRLDRLELRHKKMLATLALFAVFGMVSGFAYVFFVSEGISNVISMRQELGLKKQLLEIKEKNYANIQKNEAALQLYKSGLRELSGYLMPDEKMTEALIHSSRLMEECGLKELEMRIGEKETLEAEALETEQWEEDDAPYQVPFKITGVGPYEKAISYMERLAEDNFSYEIEAVRLSSKNVTAKGDVYLELQLCIYGFNQYLSKPEADWPARAGNPFYYE